jgi:hypothetical protein
VNKENKAHLVQTVKMAYKASRDYRGSKVYKVK